MPRSVRSRPTFVAGVDGCAAGWVAALVPATGRGRTRLVVVPSFTDVLALGATVVAVDMPIGLPEAGARACDIEARVRIGPRRSSVFATPVRPALGSVTFAEALARSRASDGRGLSRQAFNLLPRIAEVDAALDGHEVVECSPEVAFAVMAGRHLAESKHTGAGAAERLRLVTRSFRDAAERLAEPHRGAAGHDVLDAYATAWSARRVLAGTAERLGDGSTDARGRPMQIVV